MSAKPHKFWPSVGSVWSHWSDLLLATQLAALRAGFNYVGKTWDPASPAYLKLRCQVEAHARRKNRCRHALVGAAPVDPQDPSGAWMVTAVTATNLEARRHPTHCNGIGLSRRLKKKPAGRGALGPGDVITGFRDLHTLEGSLRADARRTGRFLSFGAVPKTECDLEFKCVLGTATCPFRVRLHETGEPGEEPQWRCLEIKRTHTFVSGASVPQDRLKRRLDFFVSPLPHARVTVLTFQRTM
ncbi:hypothetical protein DMC30DRAFT_137820 [Rhodotorula diobovata]|uniref:Uncharacterized protein n=1 Tax=Rhodotorula diobovata TaxID=5288 RepID=A0A5C5FLI0_9BASI|nr:hypothetical protein DMC30DRAFT_137820 [Rhodotorula diobovata]